MNLTNNNILNGTFNMTTRIYNVSTGGTALLEQNFTDIIIDTNGIYNLTINTTTLDFTEDYYLGLIVNNDTEMPRIPLTTSPYADIADNLEQTTINNLNSTWNYTTDTDTNTQWNLTGSIYIYNNSNILEVNESKFNDTALQICIGLNATWNYTIDTDTTIGNCSGEGSCGLITYDSELTYTNDTNTWWNISGALYLWNNSNILNLNETMLNATIDARSDFDTDTNTWWTIDLTDFINNSNTLELNWTTINATIQVLSDIDTTIGNCSGDQSCSGVLYDTNYSSDWLLNNYTTAISISGTDNYTFNLELVGMTNLTALFNDRYAADTTIGNCSGDQSCLGILYDTNLTELLDNSFWNITGALYLYNNSNILSVNETKLNETILAVAIALNQSWNYTVDTDTNTWWTIDLTDFINNSNTLELNWTTINTTIDARAGADGNNYTTAISISGAPTNYTFNLELVGRTNLTATFNDRYAADTTIGNCSGETCSVTNTGTLDGFEGADLFAVAGDTVTGDSIFEKNVTSQIYRFEVDPTNHYMYDNETHIIIKGDTSTLVVG